MEWLDLGPPPPHLRRRRRLALAGIAVVAAIATVAAIVVYQARTDGALKPVPGPTAPSGLATTATTATPTATARSSRTWRTGTDLADLDLDLFARDNAMVYRIQTRARKITGTPVSDLGTYGPVTFVAGPHAVIVRGYNALGGTVIPDGQPAHALPGLLDRATDILPGPDGNLWVVSQRDRDQTVVGTDFTGAIQGKPLILPGDVGLESDGAGGLIFQGIGGTYQVTRAGPRRITRGTVVATGPHHLLISDCTTRYRCSRYLYDRNAQQLHRLGNWTWDSASGKLSPDGRYAALLSWGDPNGLAVTVLDLRTGQILRRDVEDPDSEPDPRSLIWLPDNRLLRIHDGILVLYDPATGATTTPDLKLPNVSQLTIRG